MVLAFEIDSEASLAWCLLFRIDLSFFKCCSNSTPVSSILADQHCSFGERLQRAQCLSSLPFNFLLCKHENKALNNQMKDEIKGWNLIKK